MDWWQGIWGWAVTTALAAVAAVGTVVELVQRHRTKPWGRPCASVVGTAELDQVKHTMIAVDNPGTGRILVHGVWPRGSAGELVFPNGKYRVPTSLGPGESADLIISGDPLEGYVLLMWTLGGSPRTWVSWEALAATGRVAAEFERQHNDFRRMRMRPWHRWPDWRQGVGPGGALIVRTRYRSARKSKVRAAAAITEPAWSA